MTVAAVLPSPYFADDAVTLYHADCLTILPNLGPVDVVITDPPYNVGIDYGTTVDDARGDYDAWCALWFAECLRLAPTVALTPGVANVGRWIRLAGDPTWIMAWNKPAAMGRCVMGFNAWEPVLVYGKVPSPKITDAFTATVIPQDTVGDHPCPKPRKWGTALVARLAPPGSVVLDPFAGTGTVLLAAKEAGSQAVGIETEARFCALIQERCAQDVLPLFASLAGPV